MSENDLRAVSNYRGSFIQGKIADLLLKITNFNGTPLDPIVITCTISISDDISADVSVISTGTPFQAASGYYVYEWDIDDDELVGKYTVTWEYVIDGDSRDEIQYVYIVKEVDNPLYFSARTMAFREALSKHLICAQSIPVYDEQSKKSRDRKTFYFSFPRWNQSAGIKIYRNKKIVNTGVEVNYFNGSITFDDELLEQDIINADYNFKWFSEEKLTRFLVNALNTVNIYPPHSSYNLDTIPDRYTPALLYGAAKDALRQLMMCLNFQQPAQVFGGTENAQKAITNFDTLKQNYEKEVEKLLEQKKLGPYPRSLMITTPEYTLPGGRSRWFRYLFK